MSAPSSSTGSGGSSSSSGVGMKSLMKGVKKRLSTEQMRAAWEKDGSQRDQKTETNWQELSSLPRCRMTRLISRDVIVHSLPSLRDATPASRRALLIKKLRLCSYVFAFDDTPDSPNDAKDKEVKRATLLELVNYLTVFKPAFSDEELSEIFEMLAANLFRPLPPSTQESTGMFNPEEDEPSSEPTWPHLQVVYEFLLRLATSTETDSKLLDKYFSRKFVLQLLELFDSEDPRERDYLKTILHRIYGNFMSLRPFIRRAINNVFYKFIYETDRHNGIAELLEILGSIINGFALPLKEQHKQFLQRVLLPLHKVTYVSVFHPQLSYCVTQFLEKDQTLAPRIVLAVLKFWPVTSSKKELMFLNELEEILDRIQSHHLANAQIPLFRQIGKSINSPHFQVSERAIYVLNNDVILRFITNNREQLVPILSRALISNTYNKEITGTATPAAGGAAGAAQPRMGGGEFPGGKAPEKKKGTGTVMCGGPPDGRKWFELGHWNPTIVELTADILKLFNEMDNSLMQRCNKNVQALVKQNQQQQQRRTDKWEALTREQQQQQQQQQQQLTNQSSPAALVSGPNSSSPALSSTPSHTISISPALASQPRSSPSFLPTSPGGATSVAGFGAVSPAPLSASS